jgi:ferredoxin/coenzyme F420-reducing hydrogenase delta subunit
MLESLQRAGQWLLQPFRAALQRGFGSQLNPFNHLGALTIYFFWIVLVSGIWLLIFFRTSVDGAYESVEYLTREQWYLGGVMRSLHRYASDAAIVTLVLHIASEFVFDRHRGARWFSWVTGVPLLWLVIPLGITGYWLVWDQLAWYVALTSGELIDAVPIFTVSMASNFLSDAALSDRFFTLMAFMHVIGLPLFLVFGIWLHVFRLSGPRINPPRALMAGSLVALLVLSLAMPAISQGAVDLTRVPDELGLDWFYLPVYPLAMIWSPGGVWALLAAISLILCIVPWLPPRSESAPAAVDLDNCNGCARCADDCPFGAISMQARSDGKSYEVEAVVEPTLCLRCGLCTGSCPTATPFRRQTELVPGIDLPELSAAELRETILGASERLGGNERVLVFGCAGNPSWRRERRRLNDPSTATVDILCAGHLPPSFIDFVLSRNLADGVVMAGCPGGNCQFRYGAEWTSQRVAGTRDPRLRKRVDTRRLALAWEDRWSGKSLSAVVAALRSTLGGKSTEPLDGGSSRMRWALVALAYSAFLVPLGVFSVWPRHTFNENNNAMVSVSFSLAGERVRECRRLSQEELDVLPPNMRNPLDCPRERLPVRVLLRAGEQILYEATLPPTGFWNDGATSVYQRIPVPAGPQDLFIGVNTRGKPGGFDYSLSETVDLSPGQHVVVEFDDVEKTFLFRTE